MRIKTTSMLLRHRWYRHRHNLAAFSPVDAMRIAIICLPSFAETTHMDKTKKDDLVVILSAVRRGLEPLTPCVTGTYSNQLN